MLVDAVAKSTCSSVCRSSGGCAGRARIRHLHVFTFQRFTLALAEQWPCIRYKDGQWASGSDATNWSYGEARTVGGGSENVEYNVVAA
jgi:hypothetical protein